jgi:hypothetical protein
MATMTASKQVASMWVEMCSEKTTPTFMELRKLVAEIERLERVEAAALAFVNSLEPRSSSDWMMSGEWGMAEGDALSDALRVSDS